MSLQAIQQKSIRRIGIFPVLNSQIVLQFENDPYMSLLFTIMISHSYAQPDLISSSIIMTMKQVYLDITIHCITQSQYNVD